MKHKDDSLFDDGREDIIDEPINELSPYDDFSQFGDDLESDSQESDEIDEQERRDAAYSVLKKNDKIFNNSYNMGGSQTDEREDYSSGRSDIKIDPSSPEYNLYDRDKHANSVDEKIIQIDIHNFISGSNEVSLILGSEPERKKFTKPEVNDLFEIIRKGIGSGNNQSVFVSPIHIFDSISSLVGIDTKKLFDMLTYENKEILLIELDKSYHFLDKASKEFRIYE